MAEIFTGNPARWSESAHRWIQRHLRCGDGTIGKLAEFDEGVLVRGLICKGCKQVLITEEITTVRLEIDNGK